MKRWAFFTLVFLMAPLVFSKDLAGPIPPPPPAPPKRVVEEADPIPIPVKDDPPAAAPVPAADPAPRPADPPAPVPEPVPLRIVLQDRLGQDIPRTAKVGDLIVIVTSGSTGVKEMSVEVSPDTPFDWDAKSGKLIFTAAIDGRYTMRFVASSAEGHMVREIREITFTAPAPQLMAAAPGAMPRAPAAVEYRAWVLDNYKMMTHANRKGDLKAMAGAFYSAWGLMDTGGIRDRDEAFRYLDKLAEKALGSDLEACTPFIERYVELAKQEPTSLSHIKDVFLATADGMKAASQIPGP